MSLSYFNGSGTLQRVLLKKADRVAEATDTRLLSSTFRQPYLVQFTVFLVAYCVAGKLGQATANIRSSNLGPVWPAFGVALAAVLLCGYRIWVGIGAAAFLVAYSSPVPAMAAVGQAAGSTFAAVTGAFLLRRIVK